MTQSQTVVASMPARVHSASISTATPASRSRIATSLARRRNSCSEAGLGGRSAPMPRTSSSRVSRNALAGASVSCVVRRRHHAAGNRRAGDRIDQHEAAGLAVVRKEVDGGAAAEVDARDGDVVGGAGGRGPLGQRCEIEMGADADRGDRHEVGAPCAAGSRDRGGRARRTATPAARRGCGVTGGSRPGVASTAPRDTSMSVSSCSTTAWPGRRVSRSRPMVTMRADPRAPAADGSTTSSPTLIAPEVTVPARPRKSWPARTTSCTGKAELARRARDPRPGMRADGRAAPGRRTRALPASAARCCRPAPPRPGSPPRPRSRSGRRASGTRRSISPKRACDQSDQVHLVDGQHDAPHAHQVEDGGMPPRLLLDAAARIDQQDGHVGVRGAGRHVARVLLVAGAVDDDEPARRRVEVAPGDVDGDALLALGGEAVDQQAEIGRAGGRPGRALQRLRAGRRAGRPCPTAAGRSASTCRRRRSRR